MVGARILAWSMVSVGILLVAALPVAVAADDWPTLSHDAGRSGASSSDAGGDGKMIWSFKAGGGVKLEETGGGSYRQSQLLSTPAVAGGLVFVVGGYDGTNGYVYALDAAKGTLAWKYAAGTDGTPLDHGGSPCVKGGVVYTSTHDSQFVALDAATGALKWKNEQAGSLGAGCTVDGDRVFMFKPWGPQRRENAEASLLGLNAATGEEAFRVSLGRDEGSVMMSGTPSAIDSTPAIVAGTAYVGSWDHKLYAIDLASATVKWTQPLDDSADGPPAVGDGVVIIAAWFDKTYAFDAATGTPKWKSDGSFTSKFSDQAGAIVGGDYYAGYVAVNAKTGTQKWKVTESGTPDAPAVAGSLAFMDFGPTLYALETGSGKVRWQYSHRDSVAGRPVFADGILIAAFGDGNIHALNAGAAGGGPPASGAGSGPVDSASPNAGASQPAAPVKDASEGGKLPAAGLMGSLFALAWVAMRRNQRREG